jgi:hypothetical protein
MLQRIGAATSLAAVLCLLVSASASAHVHKTVGPYHVEIGWQHEPTYIGVANAVQVIVHDASDRPVNDIKAGDLKVVISTAGQNSSELTLEPAFDLEEGEGTFGEYDATIIPTATGDYTFHLTGRIRRQAVDITVTSGAQTFDTVRGTSDIEFPTKLPSVTEIVTRLERIDARLAATPAPAGPTQASVDAAVASASDARAAADRALYVGAGIGIAGLLVGALALIVAYRAPRPGTRPR